MFSIDKLNIPATRHMHKIMARVTILLVYTECVCDGKDMHLDDTKRLTVTLSNLEVVYKDVFEEDILPGGYEAAMPLMEIKLFLMYYIVTAYIMMNEGLGEVLRIFNISREMCTSDPKATAELLYNALYKPAIDSIAEERSSKLN